MVRHPVLATARALYLVVIVARSEFERVGVVDDPSDFVLGLVARWCKGEAVERAVRTFRAELPTLGGERGRRVPREVRALRRATFDLAAYVGGVRGVRSFAYVQRTLESAKACLRCNGMDATAAAGFVTAVYEAMLPKVEASVDPPPDPRIARSLVAVARHVHDEFERAGRLTDDVPELVLATVTRWCRGEATVAEVRAARAELYAPRAVFRNTAIHDVASVPLRELLCMLRAVTSYVCGGGAVAWRELARQAVLGWARDCLRWCGEPGEAAQARVEAIYNAALGAAASQ